MGSTFIVDAGDGNTPVHHAMTIFRDSIKNTQFDRMGLMGRPNSGKPVVIDTSLSGKAGEDLKYHFVPFADVDPILGQNSSVEGNESRFDEFLDTVRVDSVDYAFRRKGRMTEQRTILNTRNEMRAQIADHVAQHNDRELFKRLSGIALTETQATWESATGTTDRVAGANRAIRASGSNGFATVAAASTDNTALVAAMTTADTISPKLIMRAQVLARVQDSSNPYRLQSIRSTNGKEWYMLFLTPEQAFDLKLHPDWFVRSVAVTESGLDKDPFATSALGTIGNVVIHEAEHTTTFLNGSSEKFGRGLLLGQNAALLGFAQTLEYTEELFDYKREMGVTGTEIRGETKLAFTNKDDTSSEVDFGVLQVISASN